MLLSTGDVSGCHGTNQKCTISGGALCPAGRYAGVGNYDIKLGASGDVQIVGMAGAGATAMDCARRGRAFTMSAAQTPATLLQGPIGQRTAPSINLLATAAGEFVCRGTTSTHIVSESEGAAGLARGNVAGVISRTPPKQRSGVCTPAGFTIANCTAKNGGAISVVGGALRMRGMLLASNTAQLSGGAMHLEASAGDPTVIQVRFAAFPAAHAWVGESCTAPSLRNNRPHPALPPHWFQQQEGLYKMRKSH